MGRAEDLLSRIEVGGEQAVEDLIATRASEEHFLEFKRSKDNGQGLHLDATDRDNLGRAISGFANSEGGVVVWGIGGDQATTRHPLADAVRFAGLIDGAVSGCTVPSVGGVRSVPVLSTNSPAGYVATLI